MDRAGPQRGRVVTLPASRRPRVTAPDAMIEAYLSEGLEAAAMREALGFRPSLRRYLAHLALFLSDHVPSQVGSDANLFADCLTEAASGWAAARYQQLSPDHQVLAFLRGLLVDLPYLQQWSIHGVRQAQVVQWDPFIGIGSGDNPLSHWIESLDGGLQMIRGYRYDMPTWRRLPAPAFRAQIAGAHLRLWTDDPQHDDGLLNAMAHRMFLVGRLCLDEVILQ